jgi:hypothetical protein
MQQLTTTEPKKIRLALSGSSNSNLTYNALRLAYGLCGDWWRIAVIDTTGCASKYSHLGMFTTVNLAPPFAPQRYYDALEICSEMDVIIVNSISPEYAGHGGVLDQLETGEYEAALRAHRAFLIGIRESTAHVICTTTVRSRLSCKERGRITLVQEPVQQNGIERHFHTFLHLDRSGRATVVKDDTMLLPQKQSFLLGPEVGAQLQRWCNGSQTVPDQLQWKINGCSTISELYQLLFNTDVDDPAVMAAFTKKRLQLEGSREVVEELTDVPF